ncbi:MAG: flagellar export chaperone FlgN [Vampirovibrionales bacterium]
MHPASLAHTIQHTTTTASVLPPWPPVAVEALKKVLEAQLPLHKLVLEALLTKKVAVLSNNMQAIQEIDTYLKQCQKQLRSLEKERLALFHQYAPNDVSFRLEVFINQCLMSAIGTEATRPWVTLHQELQSVLAQIERANQEVASLLEISMGWVQTSLQALKKATLQQGGQAYTGVTAKGGKGYQTKPKTPIFQTSLHQHQV